MYTGWKANKITVEVIPRRDVCGHPLDLKQMHVSESDIVNILKGVGREHGVVDVLPLGDTERHMELKPVVDEDKYLKQGGIGYHILQIQ